MYGGPIGTHQRSFGRYNPRPFMASPSSRLGVCNLATPLISGTGKATDFKFGRYIDRANPNKSPLKILEKMEHGRIQGVPNFLGVPPIISETGKTTDFKFGGYIYMANPNKSPLKFFKKMEHGRIQGVPKY